MLSISLDLFCLVFLTLPAPSFTHIHRETYRKRHTERKTATKLIIFEWEAYALLGGNIFAAQEKKIHISAKQKSESSVNEM